MNFKRLHNKIVTGLLDGKGMASHANRRAAFDNKGLSQPLAALMDKVVNYAYKISDEDIHAVKNSGVSEDQIFELVICAAVGESTRQYEKALKVLDEAVSTGGDNDAPGNTK